MYKYQKSTVCRPYHLVGETNIAPATPTRHQSGHNSNLQQTNVLMCRLSSTHRLQQSNVLLYRLSSAHRLIGGTAEHLDSKNVSSLLTLQLHAKAVSLHFMMWVICNQFSGILCSKWHQPHRLRPTTVSTQQLSCRTNFRTHHFLQIYTSRTKIS